MCNLWYLESVHIHVWLGKHISVSALVYKCKLFICIFYRRKENTPLFEQFA